MIMIYYVFSNLKLYLSYKAKITLKIVNRKDRSKDLVCSEYYLAFNIQ